jgi:uncharacterized protein
MCPSPAAYSPRIADDELAALLRAGGAVLIEGPRACGKTETARHAAASEVDLETDANARAAANLDPALVLDGPKPRLVDEWQLVPELWAHVRRDVDAHGGEAGRYILTGSAVPADDSTRHSGAGRIVRLRMRPMSLFETSHSSGEVSLSGLFEGSPVRARESTMNVPALADLICVGGWPALQTRSVDDATRVVRAYVDETSRSDVQRVDGVRRDPARVRQLMRSIARYTASTVSARAIASDVGGADGSMKAHTAIDYISALERVFVVEDQPAWAPALRSRSRLREAPKRHFVDPSLAAAALGTGPERLVREVDTLGLLFESLVIRDLRIYAQAMDAEVMHYHDNTGLEADAIVQKRDGAWAAFEVKLGNASVDAAAESLLRLAGRVDPERHGRPASLAVITGWGYGYQRPDGVSVIPIGSFRP